ncbi:FAS1-like dehydratase domain-containing protein [Rhodococcus artemisiae]|uniref:MaoC family dehydratase N-terminal domain-containing protein n=1 Tax=Rhodococcus artemisiae TaxID=714159 RepID=A0ABU7LBB3_9NOCA|nr:MaoC family dehydratase N-terminal domain-containing protein [Rhodococcus artemisiae]MEE2058810.1 MaoC family dehydratase N-terminal domain-containing protein [Rhodococcus artemisiae]
MSYEFPIDYSKVQEFARAVHADPQAHAGRDAVIPPTMLTSGRMIWEPQEQSGFRKLGFDRRRILHGEEEYIFHGPLPRAGQTLTAETRIGDTFDKPGKRGGVMTFAKMITEFRDETGQLVATQNSTIIQTATTGGSEEGK